MIVPVYNDAARLRTCLAALEQQTYATYEVVVVDNASDPPLDSVSLLAEFPRVRTVYESKRGSYAARNQGIAAARGAALAFTDADCIPTPDWIANGVSGLYSAPQVGIVGGRIATFPVNPARLTSAEHYERFAAFQQERALTQKGYSATANLFTFRAVFETVGRFDDTLISGGDVEWGRRVQAAGYTLLYRADACVAHPLRHSLGELRARHRRFASAEYDLGRLRGLSAPGFARHVIASLFPPRTYLHRLVTTDAIQGWRARMIVLGVELYVRGVRAIEMIRRRRSPS